MGWQSSLHQTIDHTFTANDNQSPEMATVLHLSPP